MSGILPPDVAYKASRAQSQAIAEYLGAGGSADDTSTEGIPLLHLVLSASRKYGLVIGDRLEGAVRAVLRGRATPQTYFFLGLPWTHMRARRRRQNLVACLFTELPADVFRHAIGFWRSDRDPPYSSNFPFR